MTDDELGPTARSLAHPKGNRMEYDIVERVARMLTSCHWDMMDDLAKGECKAQARLCIAEVRAYDREQRDKLHERLAPKSDPDATRDLPLAMTKPVTFKGGLTTGKR